MKKYLALLLTMVMGMTMLVGCGGTTAPAPENDAQEQQADEGEDERVDDSANRTQLIVGFDAEYPPYGYRNDAGEYVGFDLELAAEACERLGWELIKQPIDWDAKDMELNSGAIDCIWNGFTMTGREGSYLFSEPYVDNSIVFVVRADAGIEEKDDLAGKVVMTQADSSALTALTKTENNDENLALAASFAALEQTADYNTAFMNLEAGAIDAIAVDIGVAQYQLNSRGGLFAMMEEPLSTEQYAIGFRLGDVALRDAVQGAVDEMVADGTFMEIVANYAEYNLDQMVCIGE